MNGYRVSRCLRLLVSRRWWWATLLALAGMVVMIRLGLWQLSRLEERQALNDETRAQIEAPPLDLNQVDPTRITPGEAGFQQVAVTGAYDIDRQVRLVQQRYGGRLGNHVLTPLRIAGSEWAVLVDRGWVPATDDGSPGWPDYDVPGEVTVRGYLRETEARQATSPVVGTVADPVDEWYRVDVEAIGSQLPYPVAAYYILAQPADSAEGDNVGPPYRERPAIDLSDGPHLGYAVQWFIFTVILGAGYAYLVCRSPRPETADDG